MWGSIPRGERAPGELFIYFNIDTYKYNQYSITNNANLHLRYLHASSPTIGLIKKTFMDKNKIFYYTKKKGKINERGNLSGRAMEGGGVLWGELYAENKT